MPCPGHETGSRVSGFFFVVIVKAGDRISRIVVVVVVVADVSLRRDQVMRYPLLFLAFNGNLDFSPEK
jgi:hypothetical protein